MDRGAWQAIVHEVAKSQTGLSDFTFTFTFTFIPELRASLVAQLVKNLPVMRSTCVGSTW